MELVEDHDVEMDNFPGVFRVPVNSAAPPHVILQQQLERDEKCGAPTDERVSPFDEPCHDKVHEVDPVTEETTEPTKGIILKEPKYTMCFLQAFAVPEVRLIQQRAQPVIPLLGEACPDPTYRERIQEPVEEDTITFGCIRDNSSLPSEPIEKERPREPCPWPQVSNEESARRKGMPHREETPYCCCCRSLFRKQNSNSGEDVPLQETRSARMVTDVESDFDDGLGTSSPMIQREAGVTGKEEASESEKGEFGISQACLLECGYLAAGTHARTHARTHAHTYTRTHAHVRTHM